MGRAGRKGDDPNIHLRDLCTKALGIVLNVEGKYGIDIALGCKGMRM